MKTQYWTVRISPSNPRNRVTLNFDTKSEAVEEARSHLGNDGSDTDITVFSKTGEAIACATASDNRLTWIK